LTSAAVIACPPIAHSPLGVSVITVWVTGRSDSPSTAITASDTRSTISRFSSGVNTPSMTLMPMNGSSAPLLVVG
jgi:hypothetical protein